MGNDLPYAPIETESSHYVTTNPKGHGDGDNKECRKVGRMPLLTFPAFLLSSFVYCKRPKSDGFPSMTPCSLIGGSLDDPHNPNTWLSNDLRGAYPLIKRLIGGSVDEPLEIKNEPRVKHGSNTDNGCGVGRPQNQVRGKPAHNRGQLAGGVGVFRPWPIGHHSHLLRVGKRGKVTRSNVRSICDLRYYG